MSNGPGKNPFGPITEEKIILHVHDNLIID